MEELYYHIAYTLQAPENAIGQYNRKADEILKLNIMPERFRVLSSEPENSYGIRRMPVDNYSVFYVVKENKVVVTNVLYNGSDIERWLRG